MHIKVNKNTFVKVLGRVYRIVDRRHIAMILGNLLLEASDNKIILKATDLEIEIIEEMEAVCLQPGSITLPAYLLYDLIKRLPNESEISIKLDDNGDLVHISAGRLFYDLKSLPAKDFPALEFGNWSHKFVIPRQDFKRLLSRTFQAMANEETRFSLNGINMSVRDKAPGEKVLEFAATDVRRLAIDAIPAPEGSEQIDDVIIPRKAVHELQKMLNEDLCENVIVKLSESKISFDFGSVSLRSKLIDGRFPSYDDIIPTQSNDILRVPRDEFISMVTSVSVVASDNARALIFNVSEDNLKLSMESLTADRAEADIICQYSGEDLEMGLNARYLIDEASQFVNEDLLFEFNTDRGLCIMRDGDSKYLIYLLMCMNY